VRRDLKITLVAFGAALAGAAIYMLTGGPAAVGWALLVLIAVIALGAHFTPSLRTRRTPLTLAALLVAGPLTGLVASALDADHWVTLGLGVMAMLLVSLTDREAFYGSGSPRRSPRHRER